MCLHRVFICLLNCSFFCLFVCSFVCLFVSMFICIAMIASALQPVLQKNMQPCKINQKCKIGKIQRKLRQRNLIIFMDKQTN